MKSAHSLDFEIGTALFRVFEVVPGMFEFGEIKSRLPASYQGIGQGDVQSVLGCDVNCKLCGRMCFLRVVIPSLNPTENHVSVREPPTIFMSGGEAYHLIRV